MPSFYLKQPNGLYAHFSTIVDDFTALGLTRDEALVRAQDDCGKDAGAQKIARADADEDAAEWESKAPEGLRRWTGSLDRVVSVHGEARAAERRRAGETPVAPKPPTRTGTKVTVGWMLRFSGGERPYLSALYGGQWDCEQTQGEALRLTRKRARKTCRFIRLCGIEVKVVRLVRWVP